MTRRSVVPVAAATIALLHIITKATAHTATITRRAINTDQDRPNIQTTAPMPAVLNGIDKHSLQDHFQKKVWSPDVTESISCVFFL